ncbi:cilia- and flagella-associated protein 69-like [Sinocyclocheilus rhinocerous]|uniref:cilia- and flagella-associated protein 69-like n=1 Tax=Sinocyclocheilus rhinocerous TaxID=307959 RepID=UPI0007B9D20A|nr:PREDICTED: cilia- and flagella-associated protein 69-like [Sinocyclocheilus rhinocerous]
MLTPLVSVLLELCESPQAVTHLLRWSGERDASAPQLLLHIWRREEEQTGVSRDPHGMITDVKRPIVSRHQDESSSSSSSHDVSAAVRDVSENLRANIYCIFCKLGFERLSGLSAEDHVTLSIIHRYLDFKLCEVVQELWSEAAPVVPSDEAALKSVLQVSEATAESVRSLQQSILGQRQQQELQEEQRLYSEIRFTHKQREIAADAWKSYVARTSNYSVLKEFRRLREERSTSEHDAASDAETNEPAPLTV